MTDAIWVRSDVAPDGTYIAAVDGGDDGDWSIPLTPDRAVAYAMKVLTAVQQADYDAAVLRQMTEKLGLDDHHGVEVVSNMRKDRPPTDPTTSTETAPLRFEPIVLSKTREPAVNVLLRGEPISQWALDDAREHAMFVLETTVAADLDGAYLRVLTGVVGIDEATARNVVEDVAAWRQDARKVREPQE